MHLQTTNAWVGSATVGDHHGDYDFIGARCIVHTSFHGIKVAAHKGCVFVAQGHINRGSQCALLFGEGTSAAPLLTALRKGAPNLG